MGYKSSNTNNGAKDWPKQEQKHDLKPTGRGIEDHPMHDVIERRLRTQAFTLGGEKWEAIIYPDGSIGLDIASHHAPVIRKFSNSLEFAAWVDYMNLLFAVPAPEPEPAQEAVKAEKTKIIPLIPSLEEVRPIAEKLVALYQNRYDWQTGIVTPKAEVQAKAAA